MKGFDVNGLVWTSAMSKDREAAGGCATEERERSATTKAARMGPPELHQGNIEYYIGIRRSGTAVKIEAFSLGIVLDGFLREASNLSDE
jgi:hypothetical protein